MVFTLEILDWGLTWIENSWGFLFVFPHFVGNIVKNLVKAVDENGDLYSFTQNINVDVHYQVWGVFIATLLFLVSLWINLVQ